MPVSLSGKKHDGMILKRGWAELQTGNECSQTIPSGPVCIKFYYISKHDAS